MINTIEIGLNCYVKASLVVLIINLFGSIGLTESSLEVELMPGVSSPSGGKQSESENEVSSNGGRNNEAFLKLLEEGFNVYEKLKIPGLAEADDLLYDYSEKEKGSRIFFPDFPDIPEIALNTKNSTGDGKEAKEEGDGGKDVGGDEDDDEETDEDDEEGDDGEEEVNDHDKDSKVVISKGGENYSKGNVHELPVDPENVKLLAKEAPFVSQRINVSAEKVPKIMNVETLNSGRKVNDISNHDGYKPIGNKVENKEPKIVLLSYGGKNLGKPKTLRPLSKDELRQAMYQHEQQDKIRNNQQKYNDIYNQRRKPQESDQQWKPPSNPPSWTVSNHNKNLKDGWKSGVGQFNDQFMRQHEIQRQPQTQQHQQHQQQQKPRGAVIDNSYNFDSLLGHDDSDYRRIVVPSTPSESDDQTTPSPIKLPNTRSNDKDFFEEHILALRSRRHRGKRQVTLPSGHLTQINPTPLGLAGLYEGPMVMPLSPSVTTFDELYRRLLLQNLLPDGGQPMALVEENSYFIPEGISPSSPAFNSQASSMHEHLSSLPYSRPSSSTTASASSSRPSKVSGYCIHGYSGQPYSCRESYNRYTPIVHKPEIDGSTRLRDIYLNYLDSSMNHHYQQHPTDHPFHHYFHHTHQPIHPSSSQFVSPSKLNHHPHHRHHSSDFDHAMSLIPDDGVTFFQPYSSLTLQPHPKAYETLDPISLTQYRDLVNSLHSQVGLGNPSIMSTDLDMPSAIHPKLFSQFSTLAARTSNSGSNSRHTSFHSTSSPPTFSPSDSIGSLQEKLSSLITSHGKNNNHGNNNNNNNKISTLFGKKKLFGSKIDSRLVQLMNKLSEEREKSKKSREIEHLTGKIRRSSGHLDNNQLNDDNNKSPSESMPLKESSTTITVTSKSSKLPSATPLIISESNQSTVSVQPKVNNDQRLIKINDTLET